MKKAIPITIIAIFWAGCAEQKQQKPFAIQDLKLGMQQEQVEKICKGSLEFVSMETIPNSNGLSRVTYRMQQERNFAEQMASRCPAGAVLVQADGKDTKPYLLTFIVAPPITREKCIQIAARENITDPNRLNLLMSLAGYQPSELIGVSQDMQMIKLQSIQKQNYETNQQIQQIQGKLEQMERKASFDRMQRGGLP